MARNPVRSPMSRPALPRASSAMSGFFFCGSIDEPVLYASARRRKPNSSLRPQHDLLAEPRQVHLRERGDEQRLGHEVAVATPRRASCRSGGRSRGRRRWLSGSSGRLEPASAPAPSGDTSARVERVAPALDVAGEGPEVREEVVREQHRLRALQVRVAGEVDVVGRVGARRASTSCKPVHVRGDVGALAPDEQPQRGGDLVVAAAAGVELRARGARELGDPALDRGVDVLVGRRELERAVGRARASTRSSAASDLGRLVVGEQPDAGQHRRRARGNPRGRRARAAGRTTGSR